MCAVSIHDVISTLYMIRDDLIKQVNGGFSSRSITSGP